MAEHFKYFPSEEAVVTPWNARYSYPSQSNKATKMTPRLPPKNGGAFQPGQIIRFEFPAQGYINPLNTTLEMDVTLFAPIVTDAYQYTCRFQNNIQSIFQRVVLKYGADSLEEILQYNVLVRALTEWTTTNQCGIINQASISDGIGGYSAGTGAVYNSGGNLYPNGFVNTRQSFIQGLEANRPVAAINTGSNATVIIPATPTGTLFGGTGCLQAGSVPPGISTNNYVYGQYCTRRYQVNLCLGLLTQDKLLPLKYMASQLAIEITLEQASACIFVQGAPSLANNVTTLPNYAVGNLYLIPEIIEFDDSYDVAFLEGLESGGVPIKFSTWHYFQFSTQGSSSLQLQINERSRSVKGMIVVQRRQPQIFYADSHALFYDSNPKVNTADGTTMQNFQFRIGGRFFPGSPVQLSQNVGSHYSNGGCEAYVELQKFLNIVGDYRLTTNTNPLNWAVPPTISVGTNTLPEFDYSLSIAGNNQYNLPYYTDVEYATGFAGNASSSAYAMAINFETSNGIEISGLNAEEQSDISCNVIWSDSQDPRFSIEVFTYVDKMIVLRPNNYLDQIQ